MNKPITMLLSALVVTGLIGAGAFALTGSASAEAEASGTTYASTTEIHGESTSGQVEEITIGSSGVVEWQDFATDADHMNVTLLVKTDGGDWQQIGKKTITDIDGTDGSYSYANVSGDVVANSDYTAADFSEDSDGEVREERIPVKVVVDVYDEDGNACYFQDVHQVVTTVENLPAASGSIDTGVSGDIHMNETVTDHCPTC